MNLLLRIEEDLFVDIFDKFVFCFNIFLLLGKVNFFIDNMLLWLVYELLFIVFWLFSDEFNNLDMLDIDDLRLKEFNVYWLLDILFGDCVIEFRFFE